MCMNRKPDPKYDKLSQYAVAILTGLPLAVLAKQEGKTADEMMGILKEIDEVNPYLYKQLTNKMGISNA